MEFNSLRLLVLEFHLRHRFGSAEGTLQRPPFKNSLPSGSFALAIRSSVADRSYSPLPKLHTHKAPRGGRFGHLALGQSVSKAK